MGFLQILSSSSSSPIPTIPFPTKPKWVRAVVVWGRALLAPEITAPTAPIYALSFAVLPLLARFIRLILHFSSSNLFFSLLYPFLLFLSEFESNSSLESCLDNPGLIVFVLKIDPRYRLLVGDVSCGFVSLKFCIRLVCFLVA